MLDTLPNAGQHLARYDSLLFDLTINILLLDDIIHRLPALTDATAVQRDNEWGSSLSDAVLDGMQQASELERTLASQRRLMALDQVTQLQRSSKLHQLLVQRWMQMESDLREASASHG